MASSSTDPQLEHSLWLQRRSTGQKTRRPQWRSDWTPVWMLLLLVSILAFFSMILPLNDAVERAEQAAQNTTIHQQAPVFGALAEQ